MTNSVKCVLVTGPEGAVEVLWLRMALIANFIERRGDTYMFTLWAEDRAELERITAAAVEAGVSLQLTHGAGDHETYETLYEHPGVGLWDPLRSL